MLKKLVKSVIRRTAIYVRGTPALLNAAKWFLSLSPGGNVLIRKIVGHTFFTATAATVNEISNIELRALMDLENAMDVFGERKP